MKHATTAILIFLFSVFGFIFAADSNKALGSNEQRQKDILKKLGLKQNTKAQETSGGGDSPGYGPHMSEYSECEIRVMGAYGVPGSLEAR